MTTVARTVAAWLLVAASLTVCVAYAQTQPSPTFVPGAPTYLAGPVTVASPGWTWFAYDVSGPTTGAPDLLGYHADTGTYLVSITNHPRVHGLNGQEVGPGDCYVMGAWPARQDVTVLDLDRDGWPDVMLSDRATGVMRRYLLRAARGCEW